MKGLDMSKPYDVGRQAARSKVPLEENPYPLGRRAEAHEWMDGHLTESAVISEEYAKRQILINDSKLTEEQKGVMV